MVSIRRHLGNCLLLLGVTVMLCAMAIQAQANSVTRKAHETYPTYPIPDYSKGNKAQIQHGEYLAKVGDCIACHTDSKNGGKPFAGGLIFQTPFGYLFSPNITADKIYGIGDWTDKEFLRAMKQGVAPDGHNYYPAFPYMWFNHVSDDDLLAIKAYLMAIPPVAQQNKENSMHFPFNWRFLQYGYKTLFFYFDRGPLTYDHSKSEQWNRGRQLVDGLAHCSMCHTPMNFLGGWKKRKYLGGAFVDGYYAPNITSYGLKDASVAEVVKVFDEEEMLGNRGKVQGPMAEVDHDSLQYLAPKDLEAIAIYLKTVPPVEPKKKTTKVTSDTGKKLYTKVCAACHTTGAAGAPKIGDSAAWAPRIAVGMDALYKNAINGINSMPPKGTCMTCSDADIDAAVDYIIAQSKGKPGEPVKKKKPLPRATIAQGKKVYEKVCSACHAQGKLGAPVLGDKKVWDKLISKNMDILYENTLKGYRAMPPMGGCPQCTGVDVQSAVKYMVQESTDKGDYSLW